MATNLRLRPDAEEALRAEAARSQMSQQDILRAALGRHLDLAPRAGPVDELMATGTVAPPRVRYRKIAPKLVLPTGPPVLIDRF